MEKGGGQLDNRSLMILLEAQQQKLSASGLNSPSLSQMPSVEELEARFRGNAELSPNPVPRIITSSGGGGQNQMLSSNQEAFKRLLAQMNDTPNAPMQQMMQQSIQHQMQQQNLMQMLSQKKNNDELKQMYDMMKNMGGPPPPPPQGRPIQGQKPPPPQPAVPNELPGGAMPNLLHPLQQQQAPDLRQAEVLKRPEAQLIIQNLIRGDIKQQALWQQLANPATTPRQREMLNAVLAAVNATPRGNSPSLLIPPGGAPIPIPPLAQADLQVQLLLQQQKQQMRLSPLPNGKSFKSLFLGLFPLVKM